MFNLYDHAGNEINAEDIVKYENFVFGYTYYYLIGTKMMYRYDDYGMFKNNSFDNSPLDWGVTLISNDFHIWERLGAESEVYDDIFNN